MTDICRLLKLTPDQAASLVAAPGTLADAVAAADTWSDVYRYGPAIEHLLARHRPGAAAAAFLSAGIAIAPLDPALPPSRVLSPADTRALADLLDGIEPEDLAPHYDAAEMDAAGVHPATWVEWEEDFDPLGQVLEHYHFLRQFTAARAGENAAMLLHFEVSDD